MTQNKRPWIKRVDRFFLLLIAFALTLSFLFLYLLKIDRDIKNYDRYHQKLEKMINLNHQFENFFLRAYNRYIDYDEVSRVSKEFEENLDFLQKSDIKKELSQYLHEDIESIQSAYLQKSYLLEQFKTLNARVTNSIYYLYDLRKTIDEKYVEEDSISEELLDKIFFSVGKSLISIFMKI